MRIDGVNPVQPQSTAKRAQSAGGGFSVSEGGAPARAASAGATGAALGIEGLMALQAEDGPLERRSRGLRKGRAMLDALDSLKLAMLEGRGGSAAAQALAQSANAPELTGDAGLDSTLTEISVRAAVELAKLKKRQA
jgi:hypothetical protein